MPDLPSGRDGVFRAIATDVHTGRAIEVALLDGGGHAIRRTLPEASVDQLKADAALSRERYPRGYLHGTMPWALRKHLEQRLGPYQENKARWKAVIVSEYPDLLLSGYRD